jgi:hypothetical protein
MFENPAGSLRRRPYMQLSAWPRIVQVVRRTVHLCAFGHPFRKITDLWTGLINWQPTGTTGDGLCHQSCQQGSWDQGKYLHRLRIGNKNEFKAKGPGATALRNAMPHQLLQEVLDAALDEASPNQRIVIDLCAGYGSLQDVVLQTPGLIYVPVDINLTRLASLNSP